MGFSTVSKFTRIEVGYRPENVRLHEAEQRHGNTLQIVSNLVRRSLRQAESEEAREVLSTVSELIETMVRLHKLCQDRECDLAVLLRDMGRQWQRLCNGHIRIVVDAEEGLDMAQSSQTVAILIAQQLVLSAIRQAVPDHESRTIAIRLHSNGGSDATLEIEDDRTDASVIDEECLATSPHGPTLVRDLVLTLGGTVRRGVARKGYGACVAISWPL